MTDSGPTPLPPVAPGSEGADVRFFELAGVDARAALELLAVAWRRAGADVDLLTAVDQDDRWLLIVRGGGEPAAGPVPDGTRVWRFRSVAR